MVVIGVAIRFDTVGDLLLAIFRHLPSLDPLICWFTIRNNLRQRIEPTWLIHHFRLVNQLFNLILLTPLSSIAHQLDPEKSFGGFQLVKERLELLDADHFSSKCAERRALYCDEDVENVRDKREADDDDNRNRLLVHAKWPARGWQAYRPCEGVKRA